jgi:hypothetical protein
MSRSLHAISNQIKDSRKSHKYEDFYNLSNYGSMWHLKNFTPNSMGFYLEEAYASKSSIMK